MLVAIDDAADHNMSVWEWGRGERGCKLLESKCSSDPVLSAEFSPVDRNTIITCGKNHITFWLYENGMLAKRMGVFETREKPKYVTAIAFLNTGDVLSGDSNGNLLIWYRGGNTVAHSVRGAHEGPVFSILVQNNGNIITAGKDGKIFEWDPNLNRTGNSIKVAEKFGAPRVVTNGKGSRLIVGTTKNCILAGSFSLPLQSVMQGHCDEVWALSCHPSQQQFLTAGHDKTCILWDSMSHTQVWSTTFTCCGVQESVQCGCFSPCGSVVVVGGVSGYWAAMDAQTRELRKESRDGTDPIQVVKFSPDGQYLAVGSRDGSITIHQVMDDLRRFARLGKCQGHASAVVHLDWSSDSQYLQSNSSDYDLLFWNAPICRQIVQSSQLRDVEWATRTCPVSFHSLGTWLDDGVDVLSSCQASKSDIIVAGDILGNITLLSSPACHQKATGVHHQAHGSLVTNVEFLPEDTRLISCGSRDAAIMQWQLIVKH
uniref:Echinoderm microtubule-associated protein-like 2 isoform X6 n=1 Tax=Hirondellea gigas TaxID=1518452 RepID=A0A6A7G237_9CRUS